MTDPNTPAPSAPITQPAVTVATLAAAISGLGALLPGKIGPTIASMVAPFLSAAIMWVVRNEAQDWLAERRAQAPTRRGERYLRQMKKELRKLKAADPRRAGLETKIAELEERIHQHKMSQLVLQPPAAP